MKKYCKTLAEAKKQYKEKTGKGWDMNQFTLCPIKIWKLKIKRTKTRKYFVGTYMEWINL